MTKHFIIVGPIYTTKNKLQELLLKNVLEINFTLCDSLAEAQHEVEKVYQKSIEEYKGSAKESAPVFSDKPFWVGNFQMKGACHTKLSSVIQVTLYPVRKDLQFLTQTLES